MKLLIVIVNYRTARLVIDCLQSFQPQMASLPQTQVLITDNASGDCSVEVLRQAIETRGYGAWASVMPLPRNGGFAYGNNAAIMPALAGDDPPEQVLLLNPDTLVRDGAIQSLLNFMQGAPHVGIAGSRLEEPDGTPQRSAFRFPSLLSELDGALRLGLLSRLLSRWVHAPPVSPAECPTDWVAGASMMIRREVFEDIGFFDERYFMYYEEVDFCLRARRAGWPCRYVPQSRVVHLVGQSSGVTDTKKQAARRPDYWFDSRRRYFTKNRGRMYAAAVDALCIGGFALFRLRAWVQRKADRDPPKLLWDMMRHSVFARGWKNS